MLPGNNEDLAKSECLNHGVLTIFERGGADNKQTFPLEDLDTQKKLRRQFSGWLRLVMLRIRWWVLTVASFRSERRI